MRAEGANATRDAVDVSAEGIVGRGHDAAAHESERDLAALWAANPEQYVIVGELARGGMGRVLEARDVRHGRRIAIKMLLSRRAAAAERFVREARITARLQHPSIVTLYEAGRWPSGEPYLALELVAGRPLRDVVAETRTLAERLELLPHVVAVADAIAYAHDEGVIHRDLKPSNVLVGAFGETVVIDWGLARELDRPADDVLASDDDAMDSAPSSQLTVAGRTIGTPCYMPPEQARGEPVDASADVYALGAMMHHVFSGEPPYAEIPSERVLASVLAGPPRRLSALVPELPPELATLVEKAMARAPRDRYASAEDLARELKRYAAGQRVAAHSYTLPALARRFIERHRATLGVASVLLAALAVGGVIGVRRIAIERDRAEAARVAAERQRDGSAHLVDFMLVDLRARLSQIGRLDVLATAAGEVEAYYASGAAGKPDPSTLGRHGAALTAIGQIDETRGDASAARRKFETALDLAARAQALEPGNVDALALIANARALLSALDLHEGKLDDAASERTSARSAVRALLLAHPADARFRMLSAEVELATAWVDVQRGDLDAADAAWLGAIDELGRALALEPTHEGAKVALVQAWSASSDSARVRGRLDLALERVERALAADEATSHGPADHASRGRHAQLQQEQGSLLLELHRTAEALVKLRDASDTLQALTRHDPSNLVWLKGQSLAESDVCRAVGGLGDSSDARAHCATAVASAERLVELQHGAAQTRFQLALQLRRLGAVDLERGDPVGAAVSYVRCRDLFAALVDESPNNTSAMLFLAKSQRSLGAALLAQHRLGDAESSAHAGIAMARSLLHASPANAIAQVVLAALHELDGAIAAARGDTQRARTALLDARSTLQVLDGRGEVEDLAMVRERVETCMRALGAAKTCKVDRASP